MSWPKGVSKPKPQLLICKRGLHAMRGANVSIRAADGVRRCLACLQAKRDAAKAQRRRERFERDAAKLRAKQSKYHDSTRTAVEY